MQARGLRNNNPGNIRKGGAGVNYKGEITPSQDSEFRQFESIEWGYRAIFVLLYTYWKKYCLRTVEDFIKRYAPSSENDTQAYISNIEKISGLHRQDLIDPQNERQMIPLVSAISQIENGTAVVSSEVTSGWVLFITHKP